MPHLIAEYKVVYQKCRARKQQHDEGIVAYFSQDNGLWRYDAEVVQLSGTCFLQETTA